MAGAMGVVARVVVVAVLIGAVNWLLRGDPWAAVVTGTIYGVGIAAGIGTAVFVVTGIVIAVTTMPRTRCRR